MSLFTGSCVALITPFTNDGINFETLDKLIDFQINSGTDAILICGTTGEPSTMDSAEKREVIRHSIEYINKRVPAIIGTGTNSTKASIENAVFAKQSGADGTLVVTPYYNKATQKGLIAHYDAIADAVDIPIIVYNVPGRTNVNILPSTMAQIVKHKNVVGIKEASGNIKQIMEISRLCKKEATLYSGNDDHIVPVLSCGGKGVISVVANVMPKETHEIVSLFLDGKFEDALALQHKLNPLIDNLFSEVNPIPVKQAVNFMGYDAGNPRLPLTNMEIQNPGKLKLETQKLNLVKW